MTLHAALLEASLHIARRDAETLLLHLLSLDRATLLAHPETELTTEQHITFCAMVTRRAAHVPLQYITGTQEFFGLQLRVTPDTLIPRPETEHLVEAVIAWASGPSRPLRILDVGTGTGAIALALATHLPLAELIALDLSPAALAVARDNAADLHLTHRIRFLESDLLAALDPREPFEAIVSNPPYIPLTDAPALAHEVIAHEPHTALFAGNDGLDLYRRLIPAAHTHLVPGGLLALEFGFGQRQDLQALLNGWSNVSFLDDYAGIPRIALAHRP